MTSSTKVVQSTVKRKPPAAGMGRKPGSVNKATKDVRKMIAAFAENNAEAFEGWIRATAAGDVAAGVKPDPGKAADLYLKAIEYHIPKLNRTEVTGEGGGPVDHSLTVEFK